MRHDARIQVLEEQVKNLQNAVIQLCRHVGIAAAINDHGDWTAFMHNRTYPQVTILPEGPGLQSQVALLYAHLKLAIEHNPEAYEPYVVTKKNREA